MSPSAPVEIERLYQSSPENPEKMMEEEIERTQEAECCEILSSEHDVLLHT